MWLWRELYNLNYMNIDWIQQHPYTCTLPFSNFGINLEFDGQRAPELQKTYLRKSCCCQLQDDGDPDAIQKVKQNIQKNLPSKQCVRCYESEKTTGSSERTFSLINASIEQINDFIPVDNCKEFNLSVKFSNLCNLACRSCSPTFSSKYAVTHNLKVPEKLYQDIGLDIEIWELITGTIIDKINQGKIVSINLFGGESFMQPGAIKLLTWLEQQDLCKKINLHVATNGTHLPESVVGFFSKFLHVQIAVSIDSIRENFEYVRWPAKFENIEQNLSTLLKLKNNSNLSMVIKPLWNLNNIFYINDYLDWWQQWFEKHNVSDIPITNVMMYRPHHMTIQNLPVEYRQPLLSILSKAISHKIFLNSVHESLLHFLNGMCDFLDTENSVYDQFELFLLDTAKHDLANKTLMKYGNEKFYNQLSVHHQQLLQDFYSDQSKNQLPSMQKTIYQNLPL